MIDTVPTTADVGCQVVVGPNVPVWVMTQIKGADRGLLGGLSWVCCWLCCSAVLFCPKHVFLFLNNIKKSKRIQK